MDTDRTLRSLNLLFGSDVDYAQLVELYGATQIKQEQIKYRQTRSLQKEDFKLMHYNRVYRHVGLTVFNRQVITARNIQPSQHEEVHAKPLRTQSKCRSIRGVR